MRILINLFFIIWGVLNCVKYLMPAMPIDLKISGSIFIFFFGVKACSINKYNKGLGWQTFWIIMYGLPAMLPWSLLRFFATLYTLATLYYLDGYGRFKMGGYAEEYFVRPPDFNDYEWKQIEESRSMARRVELFRFYRDLHERERMKKQMIEVNKMR